MGPKPTLTGRIVLYSLWAVMSRILARSLAGGRRILRKLRLRLQVSLDAGKGSGRSASAEARFGAKHEKDRPGGICLCNHRCQDQGTWGLAREDARESARHYTRGRP